MYINPYLSLSFVTVILVDMSFIMITLSSFSTSACILNQFLFFRELQKCQNHPSNKSFCYFGDVQKDVDYYLSLDVMDVNEQILETYIYNFTADKSIGMY